MIQTWQDDFELNACCEGCKYVALNCAILVRDCVYIVGRCLWSHCIAHQDNLADL